MRILLINPNTSVAMTERMVASATRSLAPDVELVPLTAPHGLPYIASRAESVIAGGTTLEMIAAHQNGMDAVVIGAFGDPGLIAARELFDLPVTAMAEASMLTACMLAPRFAIVTFSQVMIAWYEDAVALSGLQSRFAGIRVPDVSFRSIDNVQAELEAELVELCLRAMTDDRADAVILAGAPLTGLAAKVADRVPIPLIDPLDAAIGQAALLARLRTSPARAGRFARPPSKPGTGLTPALGSWIEHRAQRADTAPSTK
ncbi:aspartate/glutamate racemase family protein [Ancylobacter defluvii]|uniref:Asp/Glu/hydantoin racemase n=1 Tax=Ancylobacter defluvii TaxID=1282440 RepID=A0A9W6NDT1_9HYPH|nr:aspartate/glutamate racemase family protein [Ancylobacter defluvii]MBS7589767.1 aspartate/glutamate racemase family protein [Ancylobacter defluvii]GLK86876.1 Asp/Glu/hydantoin racemase [Ancylobacter defluvii]